MYKLQTVFSARPGIFLTTFFSLGLALLTGCAANTSVSTTWYDEGSRGTRFDKVLVVAIAADADKRRSFEDVLARRLGTDATQVWTSNRYMDTAQAVNHETIEPVLNQTGATAVVITAVTSFEVNPVEVEAYTDVTARRKSGTAFRYDYVEKELPAFIKTEYATVLTTDVYNAQTNAHVYTLVSSATGQDNLAEVISVLSGVIAKQLRADGIIR